MSDLPERRCVFCAIASGDLPASTVHEDEDLLAFLDIHPWRPGHLLVVPKRHARHLRELPEALSAHLWRTGVRMGEALRAAVPADDVHFVLNDGPAAFQTVPHVHLHLVPRRRGDALRLLGRLLRHPLTPLLGPARREALDELALRIRSARG